VFANRFTALIDACSLAGALKRNLLLTLAEAEFFRARWSAPILDETERAIARMIEQKGDPDHHEKAGRARASIEAAFKDAIVSGFDHLLPHGSALPDPTDAHVMAAAIKTQASMIVSENLKHFPDKALVRFNLEAKSADAFIADTLNLDIGRGVAALSLMRARLKKPELTADALLLRMEADGLVETASMLEPHRNSL